MALERVSVGDVGTEFRLSIKEAGADFDASTATNVTFRFLKPGASAVEVTGALIGAGNTAPQVKYVTVSSAFLDTAGAWRYQARITTPGGVWTTSDARFSVQAVL